MTVRTVDSVDPRSWNQFVSAHPYGSVYHHTAWQEVIQNSYGYRPLFHVIEGSRGDLKAAIPSLLVNSFLTGRRIIAYPFSDFCDPLVSGGDELHVLLDLMETARLRFDAQYFEIRSFSSKGVFDRDNIQWEKSYCTHRLPLTETNKLFRAFHKDSVQRAVKKAVKKGVKVVQGHSERDLETFYQLHLITRKKHGVLIQPFGFFKNLWNALYPLKMLRLLLAVSDGRPIAGMIVLMLKMVVYYKFGASDDRYKEFRPNQLLMWEAIKQAAEDGYEMFDFGRTSIHNQGLMDYKKKWGTEAQRIPYGYFPKNLANQALTEGSRKHQLAKMVLKKAPKPIIRLSGELLYRHLA